MGDEDELVGGINGNYIGEVGDACKVPFVKCVDAILLMFSLVTITIAMVIVIVIGAGR